MASREGQGMQVAVILFAILTVILAVTTYIYYAQAEKNDGARLAALDAEKNAKAAQAKANHQLTALKFVLGIIEDRGQIDAAKGAAGGAEDTEVTAWLAQYDADMALFGAAATDTKKNYISLPAYLVNTIRTKNQIAARAEGELATEKVDKATKIAGELAARAKAEEDLKTEETNYNAARTTINETLQNTVKTANDAKAANDVAAAKAKKDLDDKITEIGALDANLSAARNVKDQFAAKVTELQQVQGVNIDNPDATIIWINQKQRLVWIDRGYDDGLGRQMSFAVYSQNQATLFKQKEQMRKDGTGLEKVKKLDPKGRIEVVRVTGPHEAECRILGDKPSNPILPGDWIHSPAWSPGQRLHFALLGFMDIDDDDDSDRETIKHIITMNGGVVDTEIKDNGERDEGKMSVNTRYVVLGDSEKGNLQIKDITKYQKTRTDFLNEVAQYSVEKISVQQLVDMMGWKPEEKTTGLGGVSDAGFRRGPPGAKSAPAAGAPPAATPPAGETPAEAAPMPPAKTPDAAEADPFGGK